MDAEERALVAQAAAVSLGGPSGVTAAPDTAPGMEAGAAGAAGAAQEEAEAEMELDDEDEGPIRVVKNYVRPSGPTSAAVGGRPYDPAKFAVSPITGELVPIAEMAEHMRVSLIDPRWKEQRDAMLARIRWGQEQERPGRGRGRGRGSARGPTCWGGGPGGVQGRAGLYGSS